MRSPAFLRRAYAVLARVSPGCPPLMGRFPNIPHPSASRQHVLLHLLPIDLHVLSTPPAFNLSQDQTLHLKSCDLVRRESQSVFSLYWLIGTRSVFALANDRRESPHKLPVSIFKERPRARPGQTANYAAFHESVNSANQKFPGRRGLDRASGKPGCRGRARSIAMRCAASTAAFLQRESALPAKT